jgi:hypothetical protein
VKTLAALVLIFLYEVGTAIVLPTPSEVPVLGYSWIPLGDRAKGTARFGRLVERHRWLARVMAWSERFVDRYGILAVFVLLSIPGFPDTASLYLFALVGKRPVVFALAAGLGTAVRMVLVLFGIRILLGPAG